MAHPVYRSHARAKNQALIRSLVQPQGQGAMANACKAHLGDFSPSLYAELDWQRFRPDVDDANVKQILDLIHGLLFVIGFPTNLQAREQGSGTIRLDPAETARLAPIFDAWQDVWFKPEGRSVLAAFDRFVGSLRTPARRAMEVDLRDSALKRLDQALARVTDTANLAHAVERILVNAQYAFLDLPWTRQAVRAALAMPRATASLVSVLPDGPDILQAPAAVASHLRLRAEAANLPAAEAWAALLRGAADRMAAVDPVRLTGDDGDWTEGRSVCGQCAMWFASRTAAAMDDRVTFAPGAPRHFVFMPQDSMVCSCPFCGFAAPNSVPALFFAEKRGQVIYLVPARDGVSRAESISAWTPAIAGLQKRYLDRRGDTVRDGFWAAAELVTHDLAEFFYAIQMGDIIAEDHVFNMIDLEGGAALVFDGEKRYARVLTPGEAQVFRAMHRAKDTPPEVAARLAGEHRSGRVLGPDDIGQVLRCLVGVNDAIDASLARSGQADGAGG